MSTSISGVGICCVRKSSNHPEAALNRAERSPSLKTGKVPLPSSSSKTYGALGDYDITEIYVDQESLQQRGLSIDDLQELVYEDEASFIKALLSALVDMKMLPASMRKLDAV